MGSIHARIVWQEHDFEPSAFDPMVVLHVTGTERVWWAPWCVRSVDYRQYRGQPTVWHSYPSGERCSTSWERQLSTLYMNAKYLAFQALGAP
jgi:hypothetical protein